MSRIDLDAIRRNFREELYPQYLPDFGPDAANEKAEKESAAFYDFCIHVVVACKVYITFRHGHSEEVAEEMAWEALGKFLLKNAGQVVSFPNVAEMFTH